MTKSTRGSKVNKTKRFIKFLTICPDKKTFDQAVKSAPDAVIKAICNAALNATRGDIHFGPKQKQYLAKYRGPIYALADSKSKSLKAKRKVLSQKGGAFSFLPLILSTVLPLIGSALLGKS